MESVFNDILEKLRGIQFACIGTTNMYLQRIDVIPKDIDFVTDDYNLIKIASICKAKIINKRGFKEVKINLHNFEVHFASCDGNSLRNDDFKKPIWIFKWGLKIPCMPLESDLKFYQQANRAKDHNKVKLIKDKLTLN